MICEDGEVQRRAISRISHVVELKCQVYEIWITQFIVYAMFQERAYTSGENSALFCRICITVAKSIEVSVKND